jgi:sugar phosphate isomerase/epimerase
MHPRAAVSAISTFQLSLAHDIEFWKAHDITNVGVSVAKLEALGWDDGIRAVQDAIENGLHVVDLIGLGPFHLAHEKRWDAQQERLTRAVETAATIGTDLIVFTTGPFAPLTWNEAADAFERALAPVLRTARGHGINFAIEHTNSLRVDVGFVHSLRDAIDLARRLDVSVCMEINACWAERDLASTIHDGVDRIALVQVSDFTVGTIASSQRLVPGDGDIPLARIMGDLRDAGYTGYFELELIGDAVLAEGYDLAIPRAVDALGRLLSAAGV